QRRQRCELQHPLMRRLEYDLRRLARFPRLDPAQHVQAPAVARLQSTKTHLGTRRAEIAADLARIFQEFRRDLYANQVRHAVLAVSGAAPVAEITRERGEAARPQRPAKNVLLLGALFAHCAPSFKVRVSHLATSVATTSSRPL